MELEAFGEFEVFGEFEGFGFRLVGNLFPVFPTQVKDYSGMTPPLPPYINPNKNMHTLLFIPTYHFVMSLSIVF